MAKTSILQILIQMAKTGNADKETIKSLGMLKQNVGAAMGAFAALAGVAYTVNKAFQATAGVFVSYAAQVRELNRLTGAGAEETSRIIQLADDMTVSYETLQKSLWFASKNGVEVNVESLARLADEYVALSGPTEQAAFLAEKFGKSGADMAKMLEQGGNAVRDMSSAINGSLVLTDQAVQEAREYELALDQLNDEVLALKVSIGSELVQGINNFLDYGKQHVDLMKETSQATGETYTRGLHYSAMLQEMKIEQMAAADAAAAHGEALMGLNPSIQEVTASIEAEALAMQEMSQKNTDMLSGILNLQSINDNYQESLGVLTEKMAALKDEQAKYTEGSSKWKDIQGDIDATGGAIDKLAADYEMSTKRIIFSMIQQQAASDGMTTAEKDNLLAIGVQMGILDQETVTAFGNMSAQAYALANGGLADTRHEMKQIIDKAEKLGEISGATFDFFVNINTSGSFPGGIVTKTVTTNKPTQSATALAEGGWENNKGWTIVGEQGFEVRSPEGYIFPHDVSKHLIASGLVPDKGFYSGGFLPSEELSAYGSAPSAASLSGLSGSGTSRRRRTRNDGAVSAPPSSESASAAVSEAVTPLAETTSQAVQNAQAVQQATVEAMKNLTAAQEETNATMQGIRDDLRNNSATVQNSILAGVEQMRG